MTPRASDALSLSTRLLLGFLAGALAVLVFHQLAILAMTQAGIIQGNPYSFRPIKPWNVPALVNSCFWGGLWGCVFALVAARLPRGAAWYAAGFAFGVLGPVLVGWFVVAPIKGNPVAAGWIPARMLNSIIINGLFGLGIAVFYSLLARPIAKRLVGQSKGSH